MAAPVVPMMLARPVPSAIRPVLSRGVACRLPRTQMPPATTYSAAINTMNGMYSPSAACTTQATAASTPNTMPNGTSRISAQSAATLP